MSLKEMQWKGGEDMANLSRLDLFYWSFYSVGQLTEFPLFPKVI